MPNCAVLGCYNESKFKNKANSDITYHGFPRDGNLKDKWVDATGRTNWVPSKHSTICSEHFLKCDIKTSKKGKVSLCMGAVPKLKVIKYSVQTCDEYMLSKIWGTSPLEPGNDTADKKTCQCGQWRLPSIPSTDEEKKTVELLKWSQDKIKMQQLRIKKLHARNRRLKKKMSQVEENLKNLEDKMRAANGNQIFLPDIKVEIKPEICSFVEAFSSDQSSILPN